MNNKLYQILWESKYVCLLGGYAIGTVFLLAYVWLGIYPQADTLFLFILVILGCVVVVGMVGIGVRVVRREFGIALFQFLGWVVFLYAFVFSLSIVSYRLYFSERYVEQFRKSDRPWQMSVGLDSIPFGIEFRAYHPIDSLYESRVAFPSGLHSGLLSGINYAGSYELYELNSNAFVAISERQDSLRRCVYRIDVEKEAVSLQVGSQWVPIPNDSQKLVRETDGTTEVETPGGRSLLQGIEPVGELMGGVRFLGRLVHPPGG